MNKEGSMNEGLSLREMWHHGVPVAFARYAVSWEVWHGISMRHWEGRGSGWMQSLFTLLCAGLSNGTCTRTVDWSLMKIIALVWRSTVTKSRHLRVGAVSHLPLHSLIASPEPYSIAIKMYNVKPQNQSRRPKTTAPSALLP